MIKKCDIVTRKSYGNDMHFTVKSIGEKKTAILSCLTHRLLADADVSDLEKVGKEKFIGFKNLFKSDMGKKIDNIILMRKGEKERVGRSVIPGKVLHIDSDEGYLEMCMSFYKKLKVPAVGRLIVESSQPLAVLEVLKEVTPDILILTGHDSLKREGLTDNLNDYSSSGFFADAVKKARQFQSSKDGLVIFAGACQSCYEEIMKSGANFASSPERIMIHALDPVFIGEKIAYSPVRNVIGAEDVFINTITNLGGLGGIESRGALRVATQGFSQTGLLT